MRVVVNFKTTLSWEKRGQESMEEISFFCILSPSSEKVHRLCYPFPSDHEQELSSSALSRLPAAAINTEGYPRQQVVEEKGDGLAEKSVRTWTDDG